MDPSAKTKSDMEDGKYYPPILRNTLHKHLLGIVDKIEPQKKHTFLNILSDSLNSILSCFKCKLPLKKNSVSFNCGHKYCEQCIKTLKKCNSCYDGNIPSNIRDFSNIFNVINEIKSNFNSDKVIYEMMRFLLMPEKFPQMEEVAETLEANVECTPSDSSVTNNVVARKSRKSSLTSRKFNASASASASKNSRKKLEFNKESNENKSNENTNYSENKSSCLFLDTTKSEQKVKEKKGSYLELQPTISEANNISTPGSNTRSKRKSNKSYLTLQPAISEVTNLVTPVSDSKRKRKASDSGSLDQNNRKSKRLKTRNNIEDSLIEDEKSEPKKLLNKISRRKSQSFQRSSDSPNKGEEKLQNVTATKVNPLLKSLENAVGDVKKTFAPERDMDAEVLDPDVWKCNDKYEKKKNLFKSVKERNKRNISIGGSLKNLLEHRKPFPKKQSPTKSDSKAEKINLKNDTEVNNISKNEKEVMKDSTLITSTKEKISKSGQISEKQVSKIVSTSNSERKESTGMLLQKTVPKKKSPIKTDDSAIESIKTKNDFQILLPIVEINPDGKSHSVYSPKKRISETEKVPELEVGALTDNNEIDQLEKGSAEISRDVEIITVEDSGLLVTANENVAVEAPIVAIEPPPISREILAEITDQQNSIEFDDPTEKSKTPLSAVKFRTSSKLGLPLFLDTNVDIFSQKGELCSSTPCVVTVNKVTKTYSKAKNNLFNRSFPEVSPVKEEKNLFDELTFPGISPIAEKEQRNEQFQSVDLFDEIIRTPKSIKNSSQFSSSKSSLKMVTANSKIVVAEVHEIPATPPVVVTIEKPEEDLTKEHSVPTKPIILYRTPLKNLQLDEIIPMEIDTPTKTAIPAKSPGVDEISMKIDTPTKTIPAKSSGVDEIIPVEIDSSIKAVEKVTENLLSKEVELTIDSENEIQPVDSDVERRTKSEKVKKLLESINNKTEKTLSSLKKNFNKNTSRLSVEKIKNNSCSTTPAKNSCHFIPLKSSPPKHHDKKENNAISTPLSKELPNFDGDTPTQRRGTPTKSVACQTTPDLHLALLKQEFSHLFEKFTSDLAKKADFPLSVYDTPTEMINEGVKITAKTPDVRLLNTTAKFTAVSSITSSEKKLADEQFMDESVLGTSSFVVASANKTANISGYAPLSPPTPGKKKLSCRLNFDDEGDVEKENILEPPEISVTLDENVTIKNAPDLSIDRSKEIDFNDDEFEDEVIASASILENSNLRMFPVVANPSKVEEDTNKTFFESDRPATPVSFAVKVAKIDQDSTFSVIPDTDNCIPENDDKNEVVTDEDDDDVDFIAGTPTSQPRRILVDTLKKIRTPLGLLRKPLDITLTEFSIVGNTTPTTNSLQPVSDVLQYSAVKKPTTAELTSIDEPAAKKKEVEKVSLELFNSSASFLSSATEKILIATSGLKELETKIIRTFCETFSATYEDKLTEKSTHLVVKTNHKNRTARTFKYLQAIVSKVRIVSMKWIHECLAHEKIVNEEKYIPLDSSGECGPLRTFHVIKDITPSPLSWLNDYCIYFTEPVPEECTLQQLQSIMQKAGAVVINNMREFKNHPKLHHIIIVSDDDDYDDEYNMKIAGWLESYEAVSVEFNWILEVIGRNRLMPFADFEVIEIPNEYLLQRNFPSVMLQSNEEDQNSSD